MKRHFVALLITSLLGGCATNDFKVVESLQAGMAQKEAQARILTFGFKRESVVVRPESGWPTTDKTPFNLSGRAHSVESKLQQRIESAESYPVSHGLLGFGQLFLFYGPDGRLLEFYRHQIN